ncbi:type IV pilus twitching motility protein PilT [Candidatus Sumerlaeota bacterium]|nr:type IV pilus twitching motility protein PilT [Candidatus Sumerlaeota bacterium]
MPLTMDEMLKNLVDAGGSDLHLLAGLRPAIRLHGKLTPIEGAAEFTPESIRRVIYDVLTAEQIKTYEENPETRGELDFAYGLPGVGRFRFNVHRQRGSDGAVVRALATTIPALDSLNLPESVKDLASVAKGLSLVTGPTGSGKTTTLAAMIDWINTNRAEHIITIEDPIEYVHNSKKSYVMQREVGPAGDTLSFKNALKYALRQDPDVILIGEMRDYVTIGIAITSAETGHLVFGTLHTSSASQTVGRIIDVFPADEQPQVVTQLASNLVGVCSQILLPKIGGGRIALVEIMKNNTAIKNQIRTNSIDGIYQSIQTGSKEGMVTMDQSIVEAVSSGEIEYEVAEPHIRDDVTKTKIEKYRGKAPPKAPPKASPAGVAPGAQPAAPPPPEPKESTTRASGMAIPPWEKK